MALGGKPVAPFISIYMSIFGERGSGNICCGNGFSPKDKTWFKYFKSEDCTLGGTLLCVATPQQPAGVDLPAVLSR